MVRYKFSGLILALTMVLLSFNLVNAGFEEETERKATQEKVTYEIEKPLLAALLTAFNIPFRGLLCISDVGMGAITMGASAGRRYSQAAEFIEQGCKGPWILTPRTVMEEQQKVEKLKGAAFTDYDQWLVPPNPRFSKYC